MSLLSRYVLTRYLAHLAAVTLLMTGLYVAVDAPERIGSGVNPLCRLPLALSHVLPVAAGAALLSSLLRMRAAGVLTVLRASGVRWRAVLGPVLAAGLAAAFAEAGLAMVAAPAALSASRPAGSREIPGWFVEGDALIARTPQGEFEKWVPGAGRVGGVEPSARSVEDLAVLSRRPAPDMAAMGELVATARAAARLGHDARRERVELWTRLLMPVALLAGVLTCAFAVRTDRSGWRAAGRLLSVVVTGWLTLAVATQLTLNASAPDWIVLVLPAVLMLACAAMPFP